MPPEIVSVSASFVGATSNHFRLTGPGPRTMTYLLAKAFAEAQKLDPEEQDALAERILADLTDERTWDDSFSRTTDDQWDRLTAGVRDEIGSGKTKNLDDVVR